MPTGSSDSHLPIVGSYQRQWCGRLGKVENCQVGVFLVGVTPAGNALLDHQLYLPESWAADAARRKKTRVPAEITFQTKPAIAATLLGRSMVRFDWVTADEEFGRDGAFLDALEHSEQRYLVEVPCDTTVWTTKPMGQTPDAFVRQAAETSVRWTFVSSMLVDACSSAEYFDPTPGCPRRHTRQPIAEDSGG